MDKEKILNRFKKVFYEDSPMSTGTAIEYYDVNKAMDIWAKEVAVKFAKWCMDNTCQDMNLDNDWTYNPDDTQIFESKTDEELFELFLQSLK